MGRKKKSKPNIPEEAPPAATIVPMMDPARPPTLFAPPPPSMPPPPPSSMPPPILDPRSVVKQESSQTSSIQIKSATIRKVPDVELDEADMGTKPSSMYGLHSHSGDLVEDDIYVSDGSLESDDDEEEETKEGGDTTDGEKDVEKKSKEEKPKLELVLTTSKMGLMRRGGISSLLGQPVNRTWVRSEQTGDETKEGGGIKEEDEEEITDPAQLLVIQQRKIEQAKQNARILESSENAGRDPCLFSKRTAFDIRMDQIEDKPWDKGGGPDLTDYMNYDLTEEDWVEYAERQLAVRQELTDAAKQKRLPDPGIVPVVPKAPTKQGDRVAVRVKTTDENEEEVTDAVKMNIDSDDEDVEMVVETAPKSKGADDEKNPEESTVSEDTSASKTETSSSLSKFDKVVGGAWGAGAKEDSMLIKLIQEQSGPPPMMMGAPMMGMPPPNMMPTPMMGMQPNMEVPPPPPPQMMQQQQHNQNQGHSNRRDMHHERNPDGPWRSDMHSQQGPPPHQNHSNERDRERYDGGRGGGGYHGRHWEQQHPSSPDFRQQPPPFQRRGPPHHSGPPGGFQQWGRGPPMGRGRGDFGGREGPPPQWGEGRKRPRDFDPRGRGGRW